MVAKHNHPSAPSLTSQNFNAAANMFKELMSRSYTQNTFKIHTKDEQLYSRATASWEETSASQPYAKNFSLVGEDASIGSYHCKGSIVCDDAGVLVWFVKEYDDREAAGQTE